MPKPWTEQENRATIREYFRLLTSQQRGATINKAAIYRGLNAQFAERTPKSFERKFQNISAILYEERMPYVNGLLPAINYQGLLKLQVLDFIQRTRRLNLTPVEILSDKLHQIIQAGPIPVQGEGSGRFGLTLERQLGIPQNSSKSADFMGIELKTKHGSTPQTLFSRTPSRYTGVKDKLGLIKRYGYPDRKNKRTALYTSFNSSPDTLGFSLKIRGDVIEVLNKGVTVLEYDLQVIEHALLSKHTETVFLVVQSSQKINGVAVCQFSNPIHCRWPSILRFKQLLSKGAIFLDFTLSLKGSTVKDHGFLWRIHQNYIIDLFLETKNL